MALTPVPSDSFPWLILPISPRQTDRQTDLVSGVRRENFQENRGEGLGPTEQGLKCQIETCEQGDLATWGVPRAVSERPLISPCPSLRRMGRKAHRALRDLLE